MFLTFLFIVLMLSVFGKLIGLAIKATWGITKILVSIVFVPLVIIGMFLSGMVYAAIGLVVVVGIISLIKSHI